MPPDSSATASVLHEEDAVREARGASVLRPGLVIGQLTHGGAERQLWHLCRGLLKTPRATPFVYCLSNGTEPYATLLRDMGVPVRVIEGGRLRRLLRLRRWLLRDGVTVVHAWLFIANAYSWLANGSTGRPLLTSARNCKRQGRLLDFLNRRAFAASRAVVANAGAVANYVQREYAAPAERCVVVPNAVDTQRFKPNPATEEARRGPVVGVGRLVPQKNYDLFLRAAAGLRSAAAEARFVIVGDGPLRASLEERARALGVAEAVLFTGERHDVEAVLRSASLLWLTSGWEGLPNVVLEAMASGVPVIATDVGGARELVRSGEEGYIVPGGDADAFVRHSLELLRDGERWRRLSLAARRRAEEFSEEQMTRRFVDLYAACGAVRGHG